MPLLEPAAAELEQEQQEGPDHLTFLELPDNLLRLVLSHLTRAADLASAAASCTALRCLVRDSSWRGVATYQSHTWTPALPGSLAWAAGRCPQVGCGRLCLIDATAAASCCPTLLPQCRYTS
jgi:hypothetical protein